jgi:DNA-directed RNA polymerase specialized sigma24 family protein
LNIDDIMAAAPPADESNATKIAAFVDFLAEAEDLPALERQAFLTGYLMGMTYVLARGNEGKTREAAADLLRQSAYWQGKGWL